jgi:hypothetical protein
MDCNCPNPTAYSVIPTNNCPVDIKQIQRILFQRQGYVWTDGTTNIVDLADWNTLKAAADATKVVVSPLVSGDPVITAGEAVTEGGGDNSTLNGVTLITGTNPSQFEVRFDSLTAAQEVALKQFMCYTDNGVYFVNEAGKIISKNLSATTHTSIPIQSYFFSDRTNEGFGTNDSFMMSFMLKKGWSETMEIITPNFNPLTEL